VAEELGDKVRIVKVDTEAEPELSSQLQVRAAIACTSVASQPPHPLLLTL